MTDRRIPVAAAVVLLHLAALWALQTGLLRRAVEVIVPAAVLSEFVTPPQPRVEQPTPQPAPTPPQPRRSATPPPAPQPVAIADPTPAPQAATGVVEPQPPAPPVAAPVAPPSPAAAPAAPPAPPAPPKIELPSSDAAYLNNPKPPYPALSKRLGEQGRVVVRVLISAEGLPLRAEVVRSSQYDRLDRMAVETAMRWRYVPGRRGGVPEAMWFDVPMNFVLE